MACSGTHHRGDGERPSGPAVVSAMGSEAKAAELSLDRNHSSVAAPGAKPLDWVNDTDDDCVESAATPFGNYNLQVFPKGCRVDFTFGSSGRRVFEVMGSTRDQAAAAAQADFDQRVQACLDVTSLDAKSGAKSDDSTSSNLAPRRRNRSESP